MDANGLRFWQVADAAGFGLGPGASAATAAKNLFWRADARCVRLDRQQTAPTLTEDEATARAWMARPSPVRDAGGSYAWWDIPASQILAAGYADGSTPITLPQDNPVGVAEPTDMAFGDDDVLYIARNGAVLMVDRRGRWDDARVALQGFAAVRLAPAPGGGAWVLDKAAGRLARLRGYPLRTAGYRTPRDDAFAAVEPNPRPPTLRPLPTARIPAGHEPIAIAASKDGRLALLAWRAGNDAVLFTLESRKWVRRFSTKGVRFPYALAWVGEARVALIAADKKAPAVQSFVYELDAPPSDTAAAAPVGDIYRLLNPWRGNFANCLADTPSYPTAAANPDQAGGIRRLQPLSRASYARSGSVMVGPFDSGRMGSVWHRLYLEASIPDHAGVRIWALADDHAARPDAPGAATKPDWSPHVFGAAAALADTPGAPMGAWCDEPSELPYNTGLLPCPSVPDRAGLFTAAIQHPDRRVRRVEGRYLWLYVELLGDSLATPEVAAIRTYGSRFSYRDRYLPALYGEQLAGADGEAQGPATPPDFLERLLTLFEGPLTQLEDKVAGSWLLTDPAATSNDALPWLGSWIGLGPRPGEHPGRFRQQVRAAPYTAQMHGALGAFLAELEIATGGVLIDGGQIDPYAPVPRPGELALVSLGGVTGRALMMSVNGLQASVLAGGAVTGGDIVVVEGFRMRRTFATILGADLSDEDDPLTMGLTQSGNSFVGDTLFLGDEKLAREALALFDANVAQTAADRKAVAAFFARLAHQVLVLVRKGRRTHDLGRITDIANAAAPAHVEVTVATASLPLIVGVASLVGVDTYLVAAPQPTPFRLDVSVVGGGDEVLGDGGLDPRGDGPASGKPVAVIDAPSQVWSGTGFMVSAQRSAAAPGRKIVRNIWTWA
ncbi:MAG TPA: hypothetical protein VN694_09770 [Caulobacteraceae bacterium]|nr:hypothetical protein [Caulobacteraceae bacterium]